MAAFLLLTLSVLALLRACWPRTEDGQPDPWGQA